MRIRGLPSGSRRAGRSEHATRQHAELREWVLRGRRGARDDPAVTRGQARQEGGFYGGREGEAATEEAAVSEEATSQEELSAERRARRCDRRPPAEQGEVRQKRAEEVGPGS